MSNNYFRVDCFNINIYGYAPRRLNVNTCTVAAILFSGHPYIGRHYRTSLICDNFWAV